MNMNAKIIPFSLFPCGFIEAFLNFGADIDNLLRNTGITRSLFESDDAKISYKQQLMLIRNGITLCNKPGLGILVGQYMDWSYCGSVGSIVNCSPSLKDACDIFFFHLLQVQPHYAIFYDEQLYYFNRENEIVFPLKNANADDDPCIDSFELDFRMAMLLRFFDRCGNKNVDNACVDVWLPVSESKKSHLYQSLPCSRVIFGQKNVAISLHRDFMLKPWRCFRKNIFSKLVLQCKNEYFCESISRTVKWIILSSYFDQRITLGKIAEHLSMSPRSLSRRLADEGASFRKIYQDIRLSLTAAHLKKSTLSIDEIAIIMGFSSASTLCRSLRNWRETSIDFEKNKNIFQDL